MNSYVKYCPNVFIAKCEGTHTKGEEITLTTQYGKEHQCIVFNLVHQKDGFNYYSVVRADGFNFQEHARRRAERLESFSASAENRSNVLWQASNEGKDFLALGEPIKIGHHSERRHRALIERNHNRMDKAVQESKKSEEYLSRAEYWKERANKINLSMPESIDFYEHEVERLKAKHEELKNDPSKRSHSFSLTYAKKRPKRGRKKSYKQLKNFGPKHQYKQGRFNRLALS